MPILDIDIWRSEFVKPWEWRRGKWLDTGD